MAVYDNFAKHFTQTRTRGWKEFEKFAHYIQEGQTVLDVGCGHGRFYEALPKGVQYSGVDISRELLVLARESYPQGTFVEASMTALPFADGSVDHVVAIASVQHLMKKVERKKVVQEMWRVLRPGGYVLLSNWDIAYNKKYFLPWWKKVWNCICYEEARGFHDYPIPWKNPQGEVQGIRWYHHLREKEIGALLAGQGFCIEKSWYEAVSSKNRNHCVVAYKPA